MSLTVLRQHFLDVAEMAVRLLADPAVAAKWEQPSALPEFSVRGLAGHLSLQVRYPLMFAREAEPAGRLSTLDEHYALAEWIGAAVDAPVSVSVRDNGERAASDGPAALATATMADLSTLRTVLPQLPDQRVIALSWTNRNLRLDDFLLTRVMELAVHADDLAVSVGVPTPDIDPNTLGPVLMLLTKLSVRRHGGLALLRALSRKERAPADIAAL